MGNPFSRLISAEQVGAYKPDPRMFDALLAQAEGPVLHVAQSRFHDIVPATAAGIDTVWINRPSAGAARSVDAQPTWTFDSLAEFTAAWH
jgi:FMN phosphatase YigB (HAD superfamily)